MDNSKGYKLYCCGSRGSKSIEGHKFNEFGGYTSCYVLKKKNYALVIDMGTGFYTAGSLLLDCTDIDIVLTHMHYDHILGLLDWNKFPKGANVNYYARYKGWFGEKTLEEFFRQPFWPITPKFNTHEAPENNKLILNESLNVSFYPAAHPDSSSLIVIEDFTDNVENDKIVVMFDCEDPTCIDQKIVQNCNILIYDGMYDDSEYPRYKGWGHSTWQNGCKFAKKIHAKKLIITHHEPKRTDDELRIFERNARRLFPEADFARSGQSWDFPYAPKPFNKVVEREQKGRIAEIVARISHSFKEILLDLEGMRHVSCTICCAIIGIVSFLMSVVNVVTMQILVLYATLAFTALCALNVYVFTKHKNLTRIFTYVFQIEIYVLIVFFMVSGSPEGFSAIWALLIPTACMLVFGRADTSALCSLLLITMIFLFRTELGRSFLMYEYTESFLLRFPLAFTAFFAIAFFLETVRRKTLTALLEIRESQESIISRQTYELREQNVELLNSNYHLQDKSSMLAKTFGKLMPDEVVNKLLTHDGHIDFAGTKSIITALQVDIRGFTAMTNRMDAMSVMKMLNHYLGEMSNIIQANNGVITEFMGDGILAVFGAPAKDPNHAEHAIVAAILMQKKVDEINQWNETNGYPKISIGVGINSGEAVLGVVGGEQRLKYDVVGRTINVTARIESYSTGDQILISEDTLKRVKTPVEIKSKFTVFPKGLDETLEVYDISGIRGEYNLFCKDNSEEMVRFENPEPVVFQRAEDDHIETEEQKGLIVGQSVLGVILKTDVKINLFSSVVIDYHGGVIGKVVRIDGDEYIVRYTYEASNGSEEKI